MDSTGQTQTVELVDWLSQLSDQQADQLTGEGEQDLDALATEQLLEYVESAAQYAGVESETIERWLDDGLVTTADGAFVKYNLDVFVRADGNPSDEERAQQVSTIEELATRLSGAQPEGTSGLGSDSDNPTAGVPTGQRGAEEGR
jgi:hypothetical protein